MRGRILPREELSGLPKTVHGGQAWRLEDVEDYSHNLNPFGPPSDLAEIIASAVDGIGMGLGYSVVICIIAFVRELIGSGTILGYEVFGGYYQPSSLFILPAGAFIVLGCTIACYQAVRNRKAARKEALK